MKKNPMPDLHKQADGLLAAIAEHSSRIAEVNAVYGEKMAAVKALHETAVAEDIEALAAAKIELVALMKENKNEFFAGEIDRVDLTHGALLHQVKEAVKRSRAVTPEALEELGYSDAVKIVKSVDWDEIEKWPNVKLAEIGTERKQMEKFEWEISGDGDQGPGGG